MMYTTRNDIWRTLNDNDSNNNNNNNNNKIDNDNDNNSTNNSNNIDKAPTTSVDNKTKKLQCCYFSTNIPRYLAPFTFL